jgi:serine/threonine protein kinase
MLGSHSTRTSVFEEKVRAIATEVKAKDVEILGHLAEGTFGIVYRARWLSAVVAVKKMRSPSTSKEDFEREVDQLKHLRHPNILSFYGTIIEGETLAIVTELMEGDMRMYLKSKALVDPLPKRISILHGAACGIRYLHYQRLVHRDVKPENFLMTHMPASTSVKLCDFGLSRIKDSTHINTLRMGGTTMYIAPEVHRGEQFDERSDVYSFSIVMWEMMTRQIPYADKPIASLPGIVGWGKQRPSTQMLEGAFSEEALPGISPSKMDVVSWSRGLHVAGASVFNMLETLFAMKPHCVVKWHFAMLTWYACQVYKIKPEILRAIIGSWSQEADERLTIEPVVGHLESAMAAGDYREPHHLPLMDGPPILPIFREKKIGAQSSPTSQGLQKSDNTACVK